jgi:hypothetical protein
MSARSSTLNCKIAVQVGYLLAAVLVALGFVSNAFASGPKERVLYAFQGGADGASPMAGLLLHAGKLYGTTSGGGASNCQPYGECGTVFELSPTPPNQWKETVLYVFKGPAYSDGSFPNGGLIADALGNLYGVTGYGGTGNCVLVGIPAGCGTVFQLSPPRVQGGAWTERVLYSFQGGADSYFPKGNLISDATGDLYGGSWFGGNSSPDCNGYYLGCGTMFRLSRPRQGHGPWTESVLYAFAGTSDGGQPSDVILDSRGALYGTTYCGGLVPCVNRDSSCGTVFMLQPPNVPGGAWVENVLYSFANLPDGCQPAASVIFDSSGNLYGTAGAGGTNYNGIVFQLTPPGQPGGSWTETVIDNITEGMYPAASLVFDKAGNLYGTAQYVPSVFELQPSGGAWTELLLHYFGPNGTQDGFYPEAPLTLDGKGNLYSTTAAGGGSTNCSLGCGTVYEVVP